MNFSVANC